MTVLIAHLPRMYWHIIDLNSQTLYELPLLFALKTLSIVAVVVLAVRSRLINRIDYSLSVCNESKLWNKDSWSEG